ncbi:MAG TPA: hypothetical protein VHQ03_07885 [Candidatus Dormibacteraeota bacterium]|nr:hypothetical protein [Candidatus Dormibacteraeota bacterium]
MFAHVRALGPVGGEGDGVAARKGAGGAAGEDDGVTAGLGDVLAWVVWRPLDGKTCA